MGILGRVRQWLRDQAPIAHPSILTLKVDTVLDDFGIAGPPGQIEIPFLEPVDLSPDLTAVNTKLYPDDLTLSAGSVTLEAIRGLHLDYPELVCISLEELWLYPDILDLFTGLTLPGCAGKAYGDEGLASTERSQDPGPLDMEICRHGLPRYACDQCHTERRKELHPKRRKRPSTSRRPARTLDVFDLLLPFLQPPIEALLAQPLLFPPDRKPYDYQIQGIKFLAEHTSALLGDEMGLGKTIETIVALQVLFRRAEIFSVLVLCRRSLLGTWEHELKKWAPELYVLKVRGNRHERIWLWQAPSSVYLTTYDTARQDVFRDRGSLLPSFDVVILDEAQEIKNPRSKKSQAVRRIRGRYRWGLSGTPVENKPEDVISIYSYLRPRLFSTTAAYAPSDIKRMIEPYFLRRRAADVLPDLPDKVCQEVWLDLAPAQRQTYERAYTQGRDRLSQADATRTHVFSVVMQLRKICNRDPQSGESCKLNYLIDQLDGVVESGQKALVFSSLPNVTLRKILPALRQYGPALFDGSLNDKQRDSLIQQFQGDSSPYVMLASVQAGGVGLTLTRANHVFHFDHWWNPAVTKQAEGRAHRIGQTRAVFVHDIYTRDTVEERIHQILQQKQSMFDRIIDDLSETYVRGAFTDEELFGLFALKPPKVAKVKTTSQRASPVRANPRPRFTISADRQSRPATRSPLRSHRVPRNTETQAPLNDQVRRTLKQLILQEGDQLIFEQRRLEGLLHDLCPDDEFEVNLLKLALMERVPTTLRRSAGQQPPAMLRAVLALRLVGMWGISRQLADWAVDVWAEALGV